ncbi:MAG: low molecular weight phosphotyrosine protein phosphatase [Gammaproteobacteria bacterium]|nr:low molecular weight phosphotyrosine protein phosphatase [Gammaproteobacteria bacterium]MCP5299513.1 low molecular weight phosphotyrosine protein phosphatase [Chromatiaceae bacterium]
MKEKVKVLFVCMGNICRSPTAHGVFRAMVRTAGLEDRIQIDSAGTHAYHVGSAPDRRAAATAAARGIDLSDLVARRVEEVDFEAFDYVLAMDQENFLSLSDICPRQHLDKIQLFMDFAPEMRTREVPDPYYGGPSGFDRVFDLVDAASRALLDDIKRRHLKV